MRKIWNPAFVSLIIITMIIGFIIKKADGDILELVQIGTRFSESDSAGSEGYDGQFVYYIALDGDPERVSKLLDVPAYRYQRILLPLLGRSLSFGQDQLIPWTMLFVSLLIHYVATNKLAEIFSLRGQSPWFALAYGLWVGIVLSIRLNLPEAVAIGMLLIAFGYFLKSQHFIAWMCLSLAVFAKETMLLFVIAFGIFYFSSKYWRKLAGLITVSVLPFALFQLWLLAQFGNIGIGSGGIRATSFEIIPFNGIWKIANFGWPVFLIFLAIYLPLVIVPSLIGIWLSSKNIIQGVNEIEGILLFVTSIIFLFLPFSIYSEPIGLLRMLSLLLLAWLLFGSKYGVKRVMIYSMFSISLNVILLSGIFLA